MVNYMGFTRTNYFSVTDAEKLRDIVDRIIWDNSGSFLEEGYGGYVFGCYGSINGLRNPKQEDCDSEDYDDDYNADDVYEALQEIVAPGDAIIITEVGYEKLRYLVGDTVVITRDAIEYINLRSAAMEAACKLLNNPQFDTQMEY